MIASAAAPALPRFVELIRVSSAAQVEKDTPENQRRALDAMRATRPGVLVRRIDLAENVSGAKGLAERPDLQQLAALSASRSFDEVRVVAVDRLTRADDPRERMAVFGLLADAGAIVVDTGGHVIDPASEIGEIDWYLQSLFASRERKKILARTTAGRARCVAAGRLAGGPPPFARTFDKRTGEWSIDEEKAATLRAVFDLTIEGMTSREINRKLDLPVGTVQRLLRDEASTGRYVYGGAEIHLDPIIDRATFEAARARSAQNSRRSGPGAKVSALVRKLATCGTCGRTLYVVGPKARKYYRCPSGDEACRPEAPLLLAEVDEAVRQAVAAFLERPSVLLAAVGDVPDANKATKIAEEAAASARKQLAKLDRDEERLARLVTRGDMREAVGVQMLKELAALRKTARAELASAEGEIAALARREETGAEVEARIAALRAGIDRATPEDWRHLVALLFPRGDATGIKLFPDGRLELRGALSLDGEGAAAVTASAPAGTGGAPFSIRPESAEA